MRWRTHAGHHTVQEKGRSQIFSDYHLRIGQLTQDTRLPAGQILQEQRLDETQAGEATTITLIDGKRPADWVGNTAAAQVAEWLGLQRNASGLVAWDVFDAVLTPGDLILLLSWRDHAKAKAFEQKASSADGRRLRRIRIVRDYGMFDRREAPQYYPEVRRMTEP